MNLSRHATNQLDYARLLTDTVSQVGDELLDALKARFGQEFAAEPAPSGRRCASRRALMNASPPFCSTRPALSVCSAP